MQHPGLRLLSGAGAKSQSPGSTAAIGESSKPPVPVGYRPTAYDSDRRSALELGWRHLGEERHPRNQPNLKVTLLSAKVPIATIINLGQKVFLSVEKVDHLDRRWVQYQRMEQVSLHRYGPDKPDKDHGAVAATAAAVLVGWTVGKWLARRNDEAIAERRRRAELRGRADRQHAAVLAGDELVGVYGDYPPEM